MNNLEGRPAGNGDLVNHSAEPNYNIQAASHQENSDNRRISFADFVARTYSTPEDALIEFRGEIDSLASSIGVTLPPALLIGQGWQKVANQKGKIDSKQSYVGELTTGGDGVATPSLTINNFKDTSQYINLRNLMWGKYDSYKNGEINPYLNSSIETYKIKEAEFLEKTKAAKKLMDEQKEKGWELAASAAKTVWESAQDNPEHPYLERKKIQANGSRIATERLTAKLWSTNEGKSASSIICDTGDLIIPIYSSKNDSLINIQRIPSDGGKWFLRGGSVNGLYDLSKKSTGTRFIAEGFATGATIFEAGYSVAIAFSAGSISKIIEVKGCTDAVAADNDKAGIKAAQATGLRFIAPPTESMDWNDYAIENGLKAVTQELKAFEDSLVREGIVKAPKPSFLMTTSDFMSPPKPLAWTIKGIIEDQSIGMLYGPSGGGKSFLAISMAASVGAGVDWYDHKVKQGSVVYANGEGHVGLSRRFKAWEIKTGTAISNVYPTRVPVLFGNPESVKKLSEEIDLLPEKPSLLVIDTLARATAGMEENSAKEMGLFIENIDKLKRDHGCSVLIVHHTGKNADNGARGSSAIKAAMDFEIGLSLTGEKGLKILCTKMKEAERFKPMAFEFRTVELPSDWINDDNERLTSAILHPVEIDSLDSNNAYQGEKITKEAEALIHFDILQNEQIHTQIDGNKYDQDNLPPVLRTAWINSMETGGMKSAKTYIKRLEFKKIIIQAGVGDHLGYLRT